MPLQGRLGVLGQRAADPADVRRRPRGSASLRSRSRFSHSRATAKASSGSAPRSPSTSAEHLLHQRVVLEAVAAGERRLVERAPQGGAGRRVERRQLVEDRPQRLVRVARHRKSSRMREQHVHVGPQREPPEQLREARLLLRRRSG